jgi:hypothetical protein
MQTLLTNFSISSTYTQVIANAYSAIPDPNEATIIGSLNTYNTKGAVARMFDVLKTLYTGTAAMQYAKYVLQQIWQ